MAVYGIANLAIGFLSDRAGRRRPFIVACSVSAVAGWAGLAFAPWSPGASAVLLYGVVGLAGAQVVPAFAAVKEAVRPAAAATSLAVVNVGAFLASGVIQPVFGQVLDGYGRGPGGGYQLDGFRTALLVPTALAVVGLACAWFVAETGPDHARTLTHASSVPPDGTNAT